VKDEYKEGLKDLEGFSDIILIYHFHSTKGHSLIVKPYMDDNLHGVFSTRVPKCPNSIGLTVVNLLKIKDNILEIEGVDIVDGTPLLYIKSYVPDFDIRQIKKIGWLDKVIHKLPVKKPVEDLQNNFLSAPSKKILDSSMNVIYDLTIYDLTI